MTTPEAGARSATSTTNASSSTTVTNSEMYEQQIENLKEQLKEKEKQMSDLQRGLEAQVHMVMELEELEQKELREYELKIDANKRLIGELGERLGQESKQKAELESQLNYQKKKSADQESQIARLEELNKVNAELLAAVKQQDNNDNADGSSKWEVFSKLEFMMESNQKLVLELAQAQEDMQKVRREVSDKELLCLELSAQLDRLASQLNTSDEDQMKIRNDLTAKENALRKSQERVQLLEKSMLDSPEQDDKQGTALLMKTLKQTEQQCDKMQQERDASLAKATKLSLALASSREHIDALQEKLEYQNSIVDRILGKRNTTVNANPKNNNNVTPTHNTPRRHSSAERNTIRRSLSATGSALMGRRENSNNSTPTNANANPNANARTFDGRRIRNFFNRGRTASAGSNPGSNLNSPANASATTANSSPTATGHNAAGSAATNTNGGIPSLAAPPAVPGTGRGLFQRKSSGESEKAAVEAKTSSGTLVPKTGKETNPFDDDNNAMFTNESVGKADEIEEACQGGGGAINLALTL